MCHVFLSIPTRNHTPTDGRLYEFLHLIWAVILKLVVHKTFIKKEENELMCCYYTYVYFDFKYSSPQKRFQQTL
jgi:hypothetical protein